MTISNDNEIHLITGKTYLNGVVGVTRIQNFFWRMMRLYSQAPGKSFI